MLVQYLCLTNFNIKNNSSFGSTSLGTEPLCTNMQNITNCNCTIGQFYSKMKLNLNKSAIYTCVPCRPGTFSDEAKIVECKTCRDGTFQPSYGSSGCSWSCDAGKYFDGASCSDCPKGHYNPQVNQTKCLEVDPGTYQDEEGQSEQKYCPSGHVSNVTGSITCQPCPIGYYMPHNGQDKCLAASLGYFVENQGSDKQEECHEGFVSAKIGSSSCEPCPEMMFQNEKGQTSCKPCPEINVTINDGAFKESGSHQLVSYPGSDQCAEFCKSGDYYNKEQNKCAPSPFRVESGDVLSFLVSNSSGNYFIKTNGKEIES